ncbi:MAG: hypothetical protein [Caudoviricetes sp.]|nr:MAG: hypothetical protein [Caudoviricetes sp.]
MSYNRIIPRDLFNEANLLKCLGRLYINLEEYCNIGVEMINDGDSFDIHQNEDDGSIYCVNVNLMKNGKSVNLFRPLNSRIEWPLIFINDENEENLVFDGFANFTHEFVDFLKS